jgi:hypothetical protein
MDIARNTLVSPSEFDMLGSSISTVIYSMQTRIDKLQGQMLWNLSIVYHLFTLPGSYLQAPEREHEGEAGDSVLRACEYFQ